ncbi:MAG: hypothetical protein JWO40_178 [Candidatus Doudnabacteria bacterium]|nr:hypothetical protein [Candidatus Doudnabacteria bacterium]
MKVVPFSQVASQFFYGTPVLYEQAKRNGEKRPLRGWYLYSTEDSNPNTDIVFEHTKGIGQLVHVAICKDDGTPLWDQPLHFENIGAITMVVDSKERIGLVKVDRPAVANPDDYSYPPTDFSKFGTGLWEVPRGMPKQAKPRRRPPCVKAVRRSGARCSAARRSGRSLQATPLSSAATPRSSWHGSTKTGSASRTLTRRRRSTRSTSSPRRRSTR